MEWIPRSVVFGIRHKRIFNFLSRAGIVIDSILACQGRPPFPKKFLTKVGWPNPLTARMQNDSESVIVECSVDGIVLTVDLDDLEWNREQAKTGFLMLATEALKLYGGDKAINRVGVVDNYSYEIEAAGRIGVEALTNLRDLGEPKDLGLRVSFRSPTVEGLTRGSVNDWRNTIIQVRSGKDDEEPEEAPEKLFISLDIQSYFDPERTFSAQLVEDHYEWVTKRLAKLQGDQLSALVEAQVRR